MRTIIPIVAAYLIFNLCLCGEETKQAEKLFSKTHVEDKFDMRFAETVRETNYSIAKVTYKKGSSVGSSMFIFNGMYQIAKLRMVKYFFKAKEWQDNNNDWLYKVYFFNDKNTALKKLLGKDYSKEAQDLYDKLGYQVVKDLERVFGTAE